MARLFALRSRTVRLAATICLLCCAALMAGCASAPEINWEARYNVYTYDDAVRDFGEPTACAGEPEGGRVCSWQLEDAFRYRNQMVMKFNAAGMLELYRVAKVR